MKHSSKHHINKLDIKEKRISPFLLLNLSLYTLSAICFMIYTTQQSYTFAEGETDLGYDLQSIDASVTVGTACTFTGTVASPHTASISNGISSDNIGTTVLNTKCNDSGGYALYAIGYTDNEYGNTDLSSDISTTYNIPTGTATSGNTSNWAMKLNQVPGTTPATIENGYNNYTIVPDDYTLVATLNTVTDTPSTSTPTGSSVSTTYSAYISPTQPAGTYTGKVKYTLVHPSTAPAPVFMQDTAKIKTLLTNYGDTMQAIDKRDGKKYWITKLADGNIWMTQNLDLDLYSNKTYTPTDTDISEEWTPVRGTTKKYPSPDYTTPYSFDPGELYWSGDIYTGSTTSDASAAYGRHYHVGNKYNQPASIAMNDTSSIGSFTVVDQSICPSGWKLPNERGDSGSFLALVVSQRLTSGADGNVQFTPTFLLYEDHGRGNYWTNETNGMFGRELTFSSSGSINPAPDTSSSSSSSAMHSLRCVAR